MIWEIDLEDIPMHHFTAHCLRFITQAHKRSGKGG